MHISWGPQLSNLSISGHHSTGGPPFFPPKVIEDAGVAFPWIADG
jgi:hypothetical protein